MWHLGVIHPQERRRPFPRPYLHTSNNSRLSKCWQCLPTICFSFTFLFICGVGYFFIHLFKKHLLSVCFTQHSSKENSSNRFQATYDERLYKHWHWESNGDTSPLEWGKICVCLWWEGEDIAFKVSIVERDFDRKETEWRWGCAGQSWSKESELKSEKTSWVTSGFNGREIL